jgi:hypothetical protein
MLWEMANGSKSTAGLDLASVETVGTPPALGFAGLGMEGHASLTG